MGGIGGFAGRGPAGREGVARGRASRGGYYMSLGRFYGGVRSGARIMFAAFFAICLSLPAAAEPEGTQNLDELLKILEADLRAGDVAAMNDAMATGALGEGTVPVAPGTPPGANGAVTSIRLGDHGHQTRFVMEVAGDVPVEYRVFTLADPYRVVVDIKGVPFSLVEGAAAANKGLGFVTGYRYGRFEANTWRVVIDTDQPVAVARDFVLDPQSGFGRRMVIDLAPTDAASFARTAGLPAGATDTAAEAAAELAAVAAVPISPPTQREERRRIVVIDAGHGGVDPGAQGPSGVKEKNVVLAFARQLAEELRASGRYEVHLTRDADIFIPLRERVAIARRHKADLFISVHADQFQNPNVLRLLVTSLFDTATDA